MEESSPFGHNLLGRERKEVPVLPGKLGLGRGRPGTVMGLRDEQCDGLVEDAGGEGGHVRSTREGRSKAALKWLVLPVLGYIWASLLSGAFGSLKTQTTYCSSGSS